MIFECEEVEDCRRIYKLVRVGGSEVQETNCEGIEDIRDGQKISY